MATDDCAEIGSGPCPCGLGVTADRTVLKSCKKKSSTYAVLTVATISLALCIATTAPAQQFTTATTKRGNEYGYISAGADTPLALIFTTSIEASLTDQYTTLGTTLREAGFAIAAVDVPCHGKDLKKGESEGLTCWQRRIDSTTDDIFAALSEKVVDVISDIEQSGVSSTKFILAIGVSRGGYVALRG